MYGGPTLLKRTPAGDKLGIDKPFLGFGGGLSFDISFNKSERPVCIGCDSVHMSVPAEVAGDIHPQVPGAADSLQHLSMQYILRLERVPGGCRPHDI